MIHILVVDDHPVVREGLVRVLEDQADFEVVGAAGSAEEAIQDAERLDPDIVLLDLELPGMDGVEALARLRSVAPNARVVVFTAYKKDEQVFGAIKAGARGYLLKGAAGAEIARAVRTVHAGGSHLEPEVAARLVDEIGEDPRGRSELTDREREVLQLLAQGLSNKQIARSLGIALRTVKFHNTSIFSKLGATNRTEAAALAREKGLL